MLDYSASVDSQKWDNLVIEQTVWFLTYTVRKPSEGTYLVAQWLRICLPMQGTRVQALVWEDPTCHRATRPMRHSYWACALEPASHNYWAGTPQLLKPTCLRACALQLLSPRAATTEACVLQLLKPVWLEPVHHNKRSHYNEKPVHHKEEQPPLAATKESPHAAMKTQHSQKKKKRKPSETVVTKSQWLQ